MKSIPKNIQSNKKRLCTIEPTPEHEYGYQGYHLSISPNWTRKSLGYHDRCHTKPTLLLDIHVEYVTASQYVDYTKVKDDHQPYLCQIETHSSIGLHARISKETIVSKGGQHTYKPFSKSHDSPLHGLSCSYHKPTM